MKRFVNVIAFMLFMVGIKAQVRDAFDGILPVTNDTRDRYSVTLVSRDATKLPNGIKDGIKDGIKEPTVRQQLIVNLINQDDTITTAILAQKTGLSQRTLMRELTALQAKGFLTREGGRKDGKWVILNVNK